MRPFRNPDNQAQIDENYRWICVQVRDFPRAERDRDWEWSAAWCLDHGRYCENFERDGLRDHPHPVDPWGPARLARAPRPREEGMATNEKVMKQYKRINLDRLPEGPPIERDYALPPFKVDYDSHEQIHQKLNGTVILIKNNPFAVVQTAEYEKGKFALVVNDREGNPSVVLYEEVVDCRGIAPAYYTYRGEACWFYRVPERQNQQGMNQRNTQYKPAGRHHSGARPDVLLEAFSQAKDIKFSENFVDLIASGASSSLRLNSKVALYPTKKKGAPCGVEYMSRPLGLIVNGACKVTDETDLTPSWIHKDLARVGLQLTA